MDSAHSRVSMEPVTAAPEGIHKLTDDVLLVIFSHLNLEELAQSAFVCRRWHSLINCRKSLWRRRKITMKSTVLYSNLRHTVSIMPRLQSVRLILGWRFAVHIAWPDAIVAVDSYAPEEVYSHYVFPTEVLLVSSYVVSSFTRFIKWAKPRHLKKIHVGEQCLVPFRDLQAPLSSYVHDPSCNMPGCLLHRMEASFCELPAPPLQVGRGVVRRRPWGSCPHLEQLSICCMYILDSCLEQLCRLGPMRVLHVTCHELESLSFLNHCASQLEVLSISMSHVISPEPVTDLFAFFHGLKHLKVLKFSDLSLGSNPSETM